jgi:cytochrome c-type biogenesis protein CcmH
MLLWLVPPLLLLGGGLALWHYGRRRGKPVDAAAEFAVPLTGDEKASLERLMAPDQPI